MQEYTCSSVDAQLDAASGGKVSDVAAVADAPSLPTDPAVQEDAHC
jgi:hypothetical protein